MFHTASGKFSYGRGKVFSWLGENSPAAGQKSPSGGGTCTAGGAKFRRRGSGFPRREGEIPRGAVWMSLWAVRKRPFAGGIFHRRRSQLTQLPRPHCPSGSSRDTLTNTCIAHIVCGLEFCVKLVKRLIPDPSFSRQQRCGVYHASCGVLSIFSIFLPDARCALTSACTAPDLRLKCFWSACDLRCTRTAGAASAVPLAFMPFDMLQTTCILTTCGCSGMLAMYRRRDDQGGREQQGTEFRSLLLITDYRSV